MDRYKANSIVSRVLAIEVEIHEFAVPTGIRVVGGLPEFTYNATITKMLKTIQECKDKALKVINDSSI